MRIANVALTLGLATWVACASNPPAKPTAAARPPGADAQRHVTSGNALEKAGCLDCLIEAFQAFEDARMDATAPPGLATDAVRGSIRTALLIDLRERQMGMSDDGYLQRAKDILAAQPAEIAGPFQAVVGPLETTPWRSLRGSTTDPLGLQSVRTIQANRDAWLALLRLRADDDSLTASLWIAFSCANSPPPERLRPVLAAPLARQRDLPAVVYELSICGLVDDKALTGLAEREPRFQEVEFWLANATLASLRITGDQLDEAQKRYSTSLAWHPRWPSVTLALAGVAMTAEDLPRAAELYDTTLMLVPDLPEAVIGRVRAVSYLGRYDDALRGADDLDRIGWFPGEAAYWRAWNEMPLGRVEDAWTHVQRAEQLWVNADVSKLAGFIELKRGELMVARGKFEAARGLNGVDCETLVALGGVHADLRAWAPSADVFVDAAACLQDAKLSLETQIANIELSSSVTAPERAARQIANRRQQIAAADRMLAQSWFNTAADYFNLSRASDARLYADKVVNDPQFGARARDLLSRLGK